jgi:hypothetical protein
MVSMIHYQGRFGRSDPHNERRREQRKPSGGGARADEEVGKGVRIDEDWFIDSHVSAATLPGTVSLVGVASSCQVTRACLSRPK